MLSSELEKLSLKELLALWKSGKYDHKDYYRIVRCLMKSYDEGDPKREPFLIEWRILMCSRNDHRKHRFEGRNMGQSMTDLFPKAWKDQIIRIANDEVNVFIRAKYYDLVWFVYKDIDSLTKVRSAYKEIVEVAKNEQKPGELYDAVDRLFSIYAETKNTDEMEPTYELALNQIDNLIEQQEPYYARKVMESILHFNKWLDEIIDYNKLIELCDKAHKKLVKKNQSYFSDERDLLELKAKCENAVGKSNRNSILNIGYSFIGEADWVIEHRKTHMVGSIILTKALEHFVNVGGSRALIEDLKKRILECNRITSEQEMTTVSDHKTVDFAEFSDWIESLEDKETTAEIIKSMMETYHLIPDYNESVEYVKNKPKDWTDELVNIQFDNGKKRSESTGAEDKLLTDIRFDYGRMIMVYLKHSVNECFEVLESKRDLDEELHRVLRESDLIDENQRQFLQLALAHYQKNEYPASIHILMFQLEGILRNLVRSLGGVDVSVKTGGIMNTRLLPDLITELQSTDYQFYKFLSMFLTEEGINYRNKMGHSEFKISNMEISLNRYLIIIVLMIISTKSRVEERKNSLEPAQEDEREQRP